MAEHGLGAIVLEPGTSMNYCIRLEDCVYITQNGPKFFTEQSPSIDRPFA